MKKPPETRNSKLQPRRSEATKLAKAKLAEMMTAAKANSDWLARIVEMGLVGLRQRSLAELLTFMTNQFGGKYRRSHIAVRLVDSDGEVGGLLAMHGSSALHFAGVLSPSIEDLGYTFPKKSRHVDTVDKLMSRSYDSNVYSAILEGYSARKHAKLFSVKLALASVAIVPLVASDKLIGLIALGSEDASRFSKGQGTDFMELLAALCAMAIENQIINSRLRQASLTDPLTGLFNRRYLDARLSEEIQRANDDRNSIACLVIDADHFKKINDSIGHLGGDAVLKEMAARIRRTIKSRDVLARFGGEEFVVVSRVPELDSAKKLAERIRVAIAKDPVQLDGGDKKIGVSASVGCCWASQEFLRSPKAVPDYLISTADSALYFAKKEGRNCVRVTSLTVEGDER